MSADTLIDEEQNKTIAELRSQIAIMNKDVIELSERRRGWVRMGMISWFCSLITYVVVMYTGNGEGQIKPEIIWSFCTGVLVTKLLDHYINPSTVKDRVS